MKKVLIAMNSLSYGGIQKALVNLLDELGKDPNLDITVLLVRKKGEYLDELPQNVKLITANKFWSIMETSNEECKKKSFFLWLFRGALVVLNKSGKHALVMKILTRMQKNIGNYDVAISFRHPDIETHLAGGSNELVLGCCNAPLKITFIHCDYSLYGGKSAYNNKLIAQFDKVAVVSKNCAAGLLKEIPQIGEKVECVYNCHNYDEIKRLSRLDQVKYVHNKPVFVTVCRLGAEKGIDRVLRVLKRLREQAIEFEWHIVGDGEERNNIEELIAQYQLKIGRAHV